MQNPFKKISPTDSLLIVGTIILLMVFSVFLIRNIQSAHKAGIFKDHQIPPAISNLLLKNKEMNQTSIQDVEFIDTWMTFQYVNFVFSVKEDYLKDALQIDDTKYPNMPIGGYIKRNNLDKTEFINKIKDSVREYMSLHPNK